MTSYSTEHLEKRLSEFTGTNVMLCAGAIEPQISPYAEERQLMARAVPKRQTEFYAGRNLAREAMTKGHYATGPILRGALGAPIWPHGIVGSITHDQRYALAAIAQSPPLTGIGIDLLETETAVTDDMTPLILHSDEPEMLSSLVPCSPPAAIGFSVKEAVVKAVSPRLNTYLDMLNIRLHAEGQTLVASVHGVSVRCRCHVSKTDFGLLSAAFY